MLDVQIGHEHLQIERVLSLTANPTVFAIGQVVGQITVELGLGSMLTLDKRLNGGKQLGRKWKSCRA